MIIYNEAADDVIVEPITLNGHDGAVNITDSDDDIDITFEDIDTAKEWIASISRGITQLEETR